MEGGRRWRCLSIGYQWTRPSGRIAAPARVTDKRGIFGGVCKRREAAASLRAEGEEEGRMLGRGEPTLSPPRFPLHQCTWMKGNAATVKRLVRGSPTNPGKRGGKFLKSGTKKRKEKIATRAAVDKGATQPGGGGGEKSSAARASIRAMMRRIEK